MSNKIYPVILCGGSGTRLWPVSREDLPKQFVGFFSDKSLLQETLELTQNHELYAPPIIISNKRHEHLVKHQINQLDLEYTSIILEPEAKNTAPAIALAAAKLMDIDSGANMFVMPSDHKITQKDLFHHSVKQAAILSQEGFLLTMGIEPNSPHTGYGYIECGDQLSQVQEGFVVKSFKEKPDFETAKSFLKTGDYAWNSGMFMFTPKNYLENLALYHPEIVGHCKDAISSAKECSKCIYPESSSFAQATSISIDYALMEKTARAALIKSSFGWSDVGEWSAIASLSNSKSDSNGNIKSENVFLEDTKNSYVRSSGRVIALVGVEDSIVVDTKDALLVVSKNKAQQVKEIAETLKQNEKQEVKKPAQVQRPWGSYESIDSGDAYQVKRIVVNPGQKLSLQYHHHRSEHWTVVSGEAVVTVGDEIKTLKENESIYIPKEETHRLENKSKTPLYLIEVQCGTYLGEDDIVRLEDVYGRVEKN